MAAIILLQSRTALLCQLAVLLYTIFPRISNRFGRAKAILFFVTIFFTATFFFTLFVKTGSSQGRWFIWKVSFQLWKEKWFQGVGFGRFNHEFNHKQAEYFSGNTLGRQCWHKMATLLLMNGCTFQLNLV